MDQPTKLPSEWQYMTYRCMECKYEGTCPTRIGEYPFCGRCGSTDLVERKENTSGESTVR